MNKNTTSNGVIVTVITYLQSGCGIRRQRKRDVRGVFCGIQKGVAPWFNLFDGVVFLQCMCLIELSSYLSWADNAGVLPLVNSLPIFHWLFEFTDQPISDFFTY